MTKLTFSLLGSALLVQLAVAPLALRADQNQTCSSNYQSNQSITISWSTALNQYIATPDAACVTHAATITWTASGSFKWDVFFLTDATSPFKPGDRWHDGGNPSDTVTLSNTNCTGSANCAFPYYGVVIDANGPHLIDPKIIVSPVQFPGGKRKKHEH